MTSLSLLVIGRTEKDMETAASGAHHGIVRFLLRKRVDVNMNVGRIGSALHGAAASGDFTISCELLDHGNNPKALGGDHGMGLEAAAACWPF